MTKSQDDLRWPTQALVYGAVRLRAFEDRDVAMVRDLATDPYVPTIGTLPADADNDEARAYIDRQRGRLEEGAGFSFCVADRDTDAALGGAGLWVRELQHGRAGVGYSVAPSARGRGVAADALKALAGFAWSISGLCRPRSTDRTVEHRVDPHRGIRRVRARRTLARPRGDRRPPRRPADVLQAATGHLRHRGPLTARVLLGNISRVAPRRDPCAPAWKCAKVRSTPQRRPLK
ncbi:hypothetical protein GCM10011492_03150 [Flexivirga endophytica]|uniref:N-acetyltransferase domain-containing protein n=1 Tax=Flexivirga endophytica TaxID=1849103 RepID=A0A916STD2_9MICO|nr:GNAT family N-acetyltransferase [Flexivirga endophytica]GGB16732.1 hypothetical protein GCM10011492_03150 [Flexivirga endophytica]GHB38807.1 hypothetical protein GCM10008112_04460 [Flexivirga endophytica]